MKRVTKAKMKSLSEWIELEAFGLTNSMDQTRPVLLFREKGGEAVLPVWLSPIEAGIALTQSGAQAHMGSPHEVALKALAALGVKATECRFTEVHGHQQLVELKFTGSKKLKVLKSRADQAISFCMHSKARFICTREYIQKCRDLEVTIKEGQQMMKAQKGQLSAQKYLN